jgi:hypothetical protein
MDGSGRPDKSITGFFLTPQSQPMKHKVELIPIVLFSISFLGACICAYVMYRMRKDDITEIEEYYKDSERPFVKKR